MTRKTFDALMATAGLVVAAVLVVAGSLLVWGHQFANTNVRDQCGRADAVDLWHMVAWSHGVHAWAVGYARPSPTCCVWSWSRAPSSPIHVGGCQVGAPPCTPTWHVLSWLSVVGRSRGHSAYRGRSRYACSASGSSHSRTDRKRRLVGSRSRLL